MTVEVVGSGEHPFAGRLWVREFASGQVEAVYKSSAAPTERERLNHWLSDVDSETRIKSMRPSWMVPQDRPEETPHESNEARAARRARQQVRWKIKAIGADRMLTCTWRANMTDPVAAKKALAHFVASCRREWPQFRYVAAPEPQERGAWHWHVALAGFVNVDRLRGFWWKAIGHKVRWSDEGKPLLLVDGEWTPLPGDATLGNVHMKASGLKGSKHRARRSVWAVDRLAGYIGKYVGKSIGDDGSLPGASYSCSRGITYVTRRFAVRAWGLNDVADAFFAAVNGAGVASPWLWLSPDRSVWWATGSTAPPL